MKFTVSPAALASAFCRTQVRHFHSSTSPACRIIMQ